MVVDFIPDIEILKTAVAVNQNFCVENIAPKVLLAKHQHIHKWIGKALYDDLKIKFDSGTANAKEEELIGYLQQVVANFGMYGFVPQASVQVSDAGILRRDGDDYKSSYKFQENNLREDYLHDAWNWLELLLIFLNDNETDFPAWTAEGKQCTRGCIINFAFQFNNSVKICGGRWMFEQLRPIMKSVECFVAEAKLGTDYYNELKAEILSNTVSIANQKVIDMLRPSIAYFTEAEAILKGWAKLTPDGLVLMERSPTDGAYKRTGVKNNTVIDAMVDKSREFANRHLDKLCDYLKSNLDDYPTFKIFCEDNEPVTEEETDCGCPTSCGCEKCGGTNDINENWVIV